MNDVTSAGCGGSGSNKHHEAALHSLIPFLLVGASFTIAIHQKRSENPIDFIENSDLSSINVNETDSGSILLKSRFPSIAMIAAVSKIFKVHSRLKNLMICLAAVIELQIILDFFAE